MKCLLNVATKIGFTQDDQNRWSVEPGSLGVRFIGRRHFAYHRVLFLVIRIRCLCYWLFGKFLRPGTSKKPIDQHKLDLKQRRSVDVTHQYGALRQAFSSRTILTISP